MLTEFTEDSTGDSSNNSSSGNPEGFEYGNGNGEVPPGQNVDEDGNIVNNGGNIPPGLNRRDKTDKEENPNPPETPENPGTEDSDDAQVNSAGKGTHIYTYDELNRMATSDISKVESSYTYDTLGNLIYEKEKNVKTDYQYNELNQLVSRKQDNESYTYSYDKRGNRIAEAGRKETREYIYDETNHLVEGTNWKGDKSAYTYNGLDVRINNTQTAHSGSVYSRDYVIDYTSLERDDLMVFAEGDGQLDYVQREVYAGSERIEQFTDRSNSGYERLLYVHEDLMGNTRYYTKANGQSYAELTYDAWGMPESPNKLLNNDHGNYVYATYTGHIFDTTLDIYFAEARFYDANTRTWLAMDPIKDGGNWYQYCYSSPLKYWDPLGTNGFTKYACDFFNSVKSGFDQAWNSVSDWVSGIDWGRFGVGLVKGVGTTALLVAGMAAILTTGGAALPVVVGSLSSTAIVWATQILGAATIAFGISDLMEAAQDIALSLADPETASVNPLRDQIFGILGLNPEDYYILEAIVGSAAAAGANVVNAFALSGQAIGLKDYLNGKASNSSAIAATPTLIEGRDNLKIYSQKIPAKEGYTDVVIHGTPNSFAVLHNGKWEYIDQRSLATYLKNNIGYSGGPVRLISCSTGADPNGIAQQLANKLGVNVLAPTDTLYVYPNGSMTIGSTPTSNTGSWVEFYPGVH